MARFSKAGSPIGQHATSFNARVIQQLESIIDVGEVMPMPAAQYIAKRARHYAHVITGYMRDHITAFKHSQLGWTVRSGAKYSGFEEWGTRFRPPHPFIRPAIEDGRNEIPKLTAKEVNAAIRARVNRA